jgi:hypothetical protein
MTTVASRRFVSVPQRDAASTWRAIVDLLTAGKASPARTELLAVSGVAASIITDKTPEKAAFVVTCDGPRTRIYCLYDESAIEGADKNEEPLVHDALCGDWRVSLPCSAGDLAWVQRALKTHSARISARDEAEALKPDDEHSAKADSSLDLDRERFMKP